LQLKNLRTKLEILPITALSCGAITFNLPTVNSYLPMAGVIFLFPIVLVVLFILFIFKGFFYNSWKKPTGH